MSAAAFARLLEDGDVKALRSAWAELAPHLPQPENDAQATVVMHRARTEAESVSFRARAYSHRWLVERELPSGLPDNLKPRAERMYPVVVDAVGVAVMASADWLKPAASEIERSMADAVEDAYAHGRRDPVFVKERMREARQKTTKALFGRWGMG